MTNLGPPLASLLRRLAECPAEFQAAPRLGQQGTLRVAAVISDILVDLGGPPLTPAQAARFSGDASQANRLRLVLLAGWLLSDPWFRRQGLAAAARAFLENGLNDLALSVPAADCLSDPERREELARLCLGALDLRPQGESAAQAADRLAALNTAERERVIAAARAAEQRAREIRAAMEREAAREAEAKSMRE